LIESELFGHERGAFTGAVERRPGCFERAQNGTLLLDEIAEMPIATQASLLRVLEERKVRRLGGAAEIPVSVRVLAATNRSPAKAVKEKKLREDLYYRLNVFHIALPPLRERREDIVTMAGALIRELNKKHNCAITQLSPAALERLEAYSWPGNVRELRNVLERAAILAREGDIDISHLPRDLAAIPLQPLMNRPRNDDGPVLSIRVGAAMKDVEESYIRAVLKHTGNDKKRAAGILGLSVRTLYTKVHTLAKADKEAESSSEEVALSVNGATSADGSE
jgi:DNA-binding NtrC family response regulator